MSNRALSPIEASPTSQGFDSPPRIGIHAPTATDNYVEDVEPQFEPSSVAPTIPTSLTPGPRPPNQTANLPPSNTYLRPPSDSFPYDSYGGSSDSFSDEQRSPAASESSHFTSVSQRGVNPNWRPPPGPTQRSPLGPSRNDVVLNANPDFTIPGAGPGRGGRGGYRGGRGVGLPTSVRPPNGMQRGPMPPMGQYPGAF